MATAALPAPRQLRADEAGLDAELRHIRDLVFVRDLFAERGATEEELAVCDTEIARQRRRLATQARRAARPLAA